MKDFSDYIQLQTEEMNRYKWIESEKAGYDLGEKAALDWIDKFAENFAKVHRYKIIESSAQ